MENDKLTTMHSTNSPKPQSSILSIQGILRDNPISIKSLCAHSENDVKAVIIVIINEGSKLLAEYKRPTPEIVIATTNIILGQYSHLCIDDVKLCMSSLFQGLYGEIIALDIERFGKALKLYSDAKREFSMSYNPSPQVEKKNYKPMPMPNEVRQILKEKIGYEYRPTEPKKSAVKVDWKTKMPDLTDDEAMIFDYFDEKWNEQGCKLWPESVDQMIEYNGKNYKRGEFTVEAKKIINSQPK